MRHIRVPPVGSVRSTVYTEIMDPAFLEQLRCPIDPERKATLSRDEHHLVCGGCSARFPIKQGLPVLVPDEVELPIGKHEMSQLPCQRRENRRKNAN